MSSVLKRVWECSFHYFLYARGSAVSPPSLPAHPLSHFFWTSFPLAVRLRTSHIHTPEVPCRVFSNSLTVADARHHTVEFWTQKGITQLFLSPSPAPPLPVFKPLSSSFSISFSVARLTFYSLGFIVSHVTLESALLDSALCTASCFLES